ncbi:transglycosylase SLT domain-containing protein [Ningiella sp. W23]|uniref:transglycosylase SLT domain-containing protein n=1 Tax=Ningiella sp. W23 TaxID=3023715 RepID=UPI003756910D
MTFSISFAADESISTANAYSKDSSDDLWKKDEQVLAKQRAAFLRAERAVWSMDWSDLTEAVNGLGDYPLVPYLIAKKLRHRISLKDEDAIREFLKQYGSAPVARSLRRDWLRYLAKRNKRELYIEFYQPTRSAELQCEYLRYQYEDGVPKDDIFFKLPELWNIGKSQHEACDPLFGVWMKAGKLTEDLVLHRIEKAADGGQHKIIPYLRTLLPDNKRYLADRWREVRRDPANVRHLVRYPGKFPGIEAQILSYGLSRLIWRDEELALKIYSRAQQKIAFSDKQRARIIHRFAIALAIDAHPEAERWLIEASELEPESETMRWHLAYLLKKQDWQSIALLIEKSPAQLTNENQFQYWLARAYDTLGRDEQAKVLYEQLAKGRHYYGFLASAQLGIPHTLNNAPVEADNEILSKIANLPATKRAYELRQLERFYESRLEWVYAQRLLPEEEKTHAAVLSSAWGWHDQSIFTLSREGYLDDVDRRFPTAFAEMMTKEAKKNDIRPEWAFAIARRESSFMTDARSSADARGLMQILPSTARYIESRRVSDKDLYEPNTNARIGNKYLRYLMNKVDDNPLLATASYNAGWGKVKDWLPKNGVMPADVWVETIPYRETRNYVKAVLAYQQIYEDKLNHQPTDTRLFARFTEMTMQSD